MSGKLYFRPIASVDPARPEGALPLAGGPAWFSSLERLERGGKSEILPATEVPETVLRSLSARRAPVAGLSLERPRLMGILNVTPDSFSDGGSLRGAAAVARARALARNGADILDVGGESTRPGAAPVSSGEELGRTIPLVNALSASGFPLPLSIDTRKADVARAALNAGARIVNDVSALRHDSEMASVVIESGAAVILVHARGEPRNMQDDPHYGNVLLDVYDHLAERVEICERKGIARARIMVDPGIGFGKTQAHNLALIRGLSLFHGLGCAILLGVSRKGFIGAIGDEPRAQRRAPGSIALALAGLRQGVQMLRVHDISETRQAVRLWQAVSNDAGGNDP